MRQKRQRRAESASNQRAPSAALLRVAEALNEEWSLDALMAVFAESAAAAVGANRASVYAYDETQTRTVSSALYGYADEATVGSVAAELSPLAVPAEVEILRTGLPLQRLDGSAFPDPGSFPDWVSDVVVPLKAAGRVQGVLYVWEANRRRVFTDDEIALLLAIGRQAGLAILRGRDAVAANRLAAIRAAVLAISRSLASAGDLDSMLEALANELAALVPYDKVVLFQLSPDGAMLKPILNRAAHPTLNGTSPPELRRGEGLVSHVLETGEAEMVNNAHLDRRSVYTSNRFRDLGDHVLQAPLTVAGQVIGALQVNRLGGSPFNENELDIFRVFVEQAAVAIRNGALIAEARRAHERAQQHAANLETILECSRLLAMQTELDGTLTTFADGIYRLAPYSAIAVFRAEPATAELRRIYRRASAGLEIPVERFGAKQGITGDAFFRRDAICLEHAERDPRINLSYYSAETRARIEAEGLHVMAVPLLVEGYSFGVVTLSRIGQAPFTDEEFATVRVFAGHVAAVLRSSELLARNRDLYLGGVRALASAVDAKDPYTRGHSDRVSRLAGRIATAMGLDRDEAEAIALAGLLHDIGKIGIPDAVLQKPGWLDDAERAVMMSHAELGATILAGARTDSLVPLMPLVRHHHEWFDGSGYPAGLAGAEIPLGAAIIAVADAFDTMVTDRPYRRRGSVERGIAELRRAAGVQFDAKVVDAFATMMTSDEVLRASVEADAEATVNGGERTASHLYDEPEPSSGAGGQMGDTRALGLLMELAAETRHIPDLRQFLDRVVGIVQRRLGYERVTLLLVDRERNELALAALAGDPGNVDVTYRQPLHVGICGQVIRNGKPRNVVDVREDPSYYASSPETSGGSQLVVPLIVDEETIGVISVESVKPAAFTSADEAVLVAVAGQAATVVRVAQLHDDAKRAASIDGLTGLANHRAFYELLASEILDGKALSVVILDVEGLKRVNDHAGHLAGDRLLRRVADVIRRTVRVEDVVARYGGDEFAIIMLGLNRSEATRIAARVRKSVGEATAEFGSPGPTVRYGAATYPADGLRPNDLVGAADRRLLEMRAAHLSAVQSRLLAGDER